MTQTNDHEKGLLQSASFHVDTAMFAERRDERALPGKRVFAERRDERALIGCYDESSDVWVVDSQPLVTSYNMALETVTFTRSGGESQDRD